MRWSGIGWRPLWLAIRWSVVAALACLAAGAIAGQALGVARWPGRLGALGGASCLAALQAAVFGMAWRVMQRSRAGASLRPS